MGGVCGLSILFYKVYDCIEMRLAGCKLQSMERKGKIKQVFIFNYLLDFEQIIIANFM